MTREEIQKQQMIFGEVYTLEEIRSYVNSEDSSQYDGNGYLHDGQKQTKISIWEINIFDREWDKYPYVCWYPSASAYKCEEY